jgi:site-specific DNA-cytosine methylase
MIDTAKQVERVIYMANNVKWNPGEAQSIPVQRAYDSGVPLPALWAGQIDKLKANNWMMGFRQTTRLRHDYIAPACTGSALYDSLHWSENRTLTHREIARLMGYPDDWRISPLKDIKGLSPTWGKGVTVDCAKWLGTHLRSSFDGEPGSDTGVEIGEREHLIDYRAHFKTLLTTA